MLYTDPPWLSRHRSIEYTYESAITSAAPLLDHTMVHTYAMRVGRETVKSPLEAARDARQLALTGLGRFVEATAACARVPLKMIAAGFANFDLVYSVPSTCVKALELSCSSLELRTPPSEWTAPPPIQLFEE